MFIKLILVILIIWRISEISEIRTYIPGGGVLKSIKEIPPEKSIQSILPPWDEVKF